MGASDINRIGILLSFVAGFLLAPQLIGLQRIGRAQQWAEHRLTRNRSAADQRIGLQQATLSHQARHPGGTTLMGFGGAADALSLYGLGLFVCAFGFVGLAFCVAASLLSGVLDIWLTLALAVVLAWLAAFAWFGAMYVVKSDNAVIDFLAKASFTAVLWPVTLILFGYQSVVRVQYTFVLIAAQLSVAILRRLQRDRLIGWMTTAGIVCFVGGNALQFWATFG